MSRWAATSTTRWRGPAGVSTIAERVEVEDGVVRAASAPAPGPGSATAAASSLRSVTGGSSSVRSTVRWLATPTRTRLLEAAVAEELAQRLGEQRPRRALRRRARCRRAAAARPRCSATIEPLTRAWTAATKPGWMSRPTTSCRRAPTHGGRASRSAAWRSPVGLLRGISSARGALAGEGVAIAARGVSAAERDRALVKKVIGVEIDDLRCPAKTATSAPSARNGPNGTAVLRPRARPCARSPPRRRARRRAARSAAPARRRCRGTAPSRRRA